MKKMSYFSKPVNRSSI